MSNITKAISQLPKELITSEIVVAAAKEHNPLLLHYLPEEYISQETIDLIFAADANVTYGHWDLSYLPEEYRTFDICLQAVYNDINNIRSVPRKNRHGRILDLIVTQNGILHLLPLIPAESWTKKHAMEVIKNFGNFRVLNGRISTTNEVLRKIQIILSFFPSSIRDFKFYLHLLREEIVPPSLVHKIIPSKFKNREYYLTLAGKNFMLVPEQKFDYEMFCSVLCSRYEQTDELMSNENLRKKLFEYLDNTLADYVVKTAPWYFKELPKPFRTSKRLKLAIKSNLCYYNDSLFINDAEDRHLLTKEVCKAYISCQWGYPLFPEKIWTPAFVDYCVRRSKKLAWLKQVPRHLITWEAGTRVFKEDLNYLKYLPLFYITPERAKQVFRENSNYSKYLPQRYFQEFNAYTGLPKEFFGGERSLLELKSQRINYTYCKIGTTYIGIYRQEDDKESLKVIMTRAINRYVPAKLVFEKKIFSFHKTWLEKLVAENDPLFFKPQVDKSLIDVQAFSYYGVQPMKNVFGIEIFCNTFMGQPIGYCTRSKGITYHTDNCGKELFEGLKLKLCGMSVPLTLKEDLKEVTQDYLHSQYGFCYPGMASFIQDYGLDPQQKYTILQLRQIVKQQGKKSSVHRFRKELKKIHII